MTHISPAIIMHTKDLGESDLLVTFFTPDRGKITGIAKGARRSRKRFANCLDLFCLVNMEYESQRKSSLFFLHSCRLIRAFCGLRTDFSSLALASYLVELTGILFPPGVVDGNMFELLKNSYNSLDERRDNEIIRIFFEARAMTLAGYGINFERCCKCGRTYTGKGRAVFQPDKGGISCLRCEHESRLSPGMGTDTINRFKAMQSALEPKWGELSLTEEMIEEIKSAIKLHIEYRIGRRLKTAKYL